MDFEQNKFISEVWRLQVRSEHPDLMEWSGEALFQVADFLYLHIKEGTRDLSEASSVRALIPFLRALLHDLITFQRPQVQIPSP